MDVFVGVILGSVMTWWAIATFFDVIPIGKSWKGSSVAIERAEDLVLIRVQHVEGAPTLDLLIRPEGASKVAAALAHKVGEIERDR
jgi:hypothetical protein